MKNSVAVRTLIGAGVLGLSLWNVEQAQAHRHDFPFTDDWRQPEKGEVELESRSEYDGGEHVFEQKIELDYGITDRLAIAPSVVFEREAGGRLKYHEWSFETRYQLGKYKTGKILPGLYLEYAQERGQDGEAGVRELEGKLILSRYDRKGGDLSFNFILERPLNGEERKTEKKYSFGYARPLGTGRLQARGGFEWIHDLETRQINAGPVLSFAATDAVWVSLGASLPLNKRDEGNATQLRLLAEYEF
jgi:hypothetical protein